MQERVRGNGRGRPRCALLQKTTGRKNFLDIRLKNVDTQFRAWICSPHSVGVRIRFRLGAPIQLPYQG